VVEDFQQLVEGDVAVSEGVGGLRDKVSASSRGAVALASRC
jgi:hypothetical protein